MAKKIQSTGDVEVPKLLIDQVIGQEKSAELIRKAAAQRRNVLLVGQPGTGKSLLARAMAEIMPLNRLSDVLVYPNEDDQNNPLVRVIRSGEGQKIMEQAKVESKAQDDNSRFLSMIIPFGWFLLSYIIWSMKLISDIIFAATMILGGFIMVGVIVGSQMRVKVGVITPKLLVNNAGKKTAPFFDGTGARAGSLLGDVRHDPLQSFSPVNKFTIISNGSEKIISFEDLWNKISSKYPELVEKHEKGYEAIVVPRTEEVYTYGIKDGNVIKTRIYSMNKRPYDGEVVELSAGASKITLTPEHKVVVTAKESKEAGKLAVSKDKLVKIPKVSEVVTLSKQ